MLPSLLVVAEEQRSPSFRQVTSSHSLGKECENNGPAQWQENQITCLRLGFVFLNHCFISVSFFVSLILYFSFWKVNQKAVAKSSTVCRALAALRYTAMHEGSLATPVTFCPGCRIPESRSRWLPCTPPLGFILRMSQ